MKKDLLLELHKLAERISHHGGKLDESMLERYTFFVQNSEYGRDCSYARKCRDLFVKYDMDDVLAQFEVVRKLIDELDGPEKK